MVNAFVRGRGVILVSSFLRDECMYGSEQRSPVLFERKLVRRVDKGLRGSDNVQSSSAVYSDNAGCKSRGYNELSYRFFYGSCKSTLVTHSNMDRLSVSPSAGSEVGAKTIAAFKRNYLSRFYVNPRRSKAVLNIMQVQRGLTTGSPSLGIDSFARLMICHAKMLVHLESPRNSTQI